MSAPPEGPPPLVLVVDARPAPADQSSGSGTSMLPYIAPALAAGTAAKFLSPAAGLGALVVGVVVVLLLRKPDEGRTVLRVDRDVLVVTRERTSAQATRIGLADLLDVTLDRTTEGGGRGGTSKERVHIALERRAPEDPIFVPAERITPIEGSEWLGRVRVFLRKHGWVPESERAEDAGA